MSKEVSVALEKMLEVIVIDERLVKLKEEVKKSHHGNYEIQSRHLSKIFGEMREIGRKRGYIKQSLRADIKKIRKVGKNEN